MKNLTILMAIFAMMFAASTSVMAKGQPANKCHPQDLECLCTQNPDLCEVSNNPPTDPIPELPLVI